MEGELLKQIDRHMGRGNELMERVEAEMRLTREQHADHTRAFQLAIKELVRAGRENREVIRENRRAMREMREASEAHTKAIWALLDRIEDGGADPAPG